MLTLATLRLALAFTAVLALVDLALILVLIGTIQASTNLLKAGGCHGVLARGRGHLHVLRHRVHRHGRQGAPARQADPALKHREQAQGP
jgi:GPR1/FUN34/yaaH family